MSNALGHGFKIRPRGTGRPRSGLPMLPTVARPGPATAEMTDSQHAAHLPLFVFGTLRQGQRNHHLLARRYVRMRPARLHGFARAEPLMIRPRADGSVSGELYFIRPDVYEATLRDCDELEGIPPGRTVGRDYCRLQVTVETPEGPVVAWAYVHPASAISSKEQSAAGP